MANMLKKKADQTSVRSKQEKFLDRSVLMVQIYLLFDYIRPQFYFRPLDLIRPGLLLTVLSIYFWVTQKDKEALQHPLFKAYRNLIIFSIMGLLWCVNHYWVVEYTKILAIFMFAGALPIALVLSDKNRIKKFLYFWLGLQTAIAIVCIVKHGVGPGGAFSDENDFALCIVMAIPYAAFLIFSPITNKREKILLSGAALIFILAVAATLSRGAMVGFAAIMVVIIWFGKNRFKIVVTLALLFAVAVPFLPPTLYKEAASIDPNETQGTAIDRFHTWRMGWLMFLDSPVLGIGVGNYPWRVLEYEVAMPFYKPDHGNHAGRQAHSVWFTVLPEYGAIGASIYFWMMLTIVNRCRYIIKRCSVSAKSIAENEIYVVLAKGVLGSLVGFMVAGSFISVLYYPHFWYLVGFCVGLDLAYQRGTGDFTVKTKNRYRTAIKAST